MSLLSSVLLPRLEKELIAMEPEAAQLLVKAGRDAAVAFFDWAEHKINAKKDEVPKKELS